MPDIIDIDCGSITDGLDAIEESAVRILYCVSFANAELQPKAVEPGEDDFIPWKRGVSL